MEGSRFELDPELAGEIRRRTFADDFAKLVQTVRRGGSSFRISLRPVSIAGQKRFQAEMCEGGRVRVKNFDAAGAADGLEEIIAQKGARELHLISGSGDLHVRVTKKGRALVSRSAPREAPPPSAPRPHDREKDTPLNRFDSSALLRATGLADGEGRVRASMRGKYRQVDEFLRIAGDALKDRPRDEPFTVVDCGCGKAYLTFALQAYLENALGFKDVRLVGIDRREDVVAAANAIARDLDVADRTFFAAAELESLADARSVPGAEGRGIDMVASLHACDTATDEALARGVEWRARHIISAPCCQHELQKALSGGGTRPGEFSGLLRQSILRERMCDILTDAFRAMILRIMGFRTQVVEFVSPDATARNILLRAEYGVKPGQAGPVSEYLALRDYWRVTPWLETRLGEPLARILSGRGFSRG